MDSKICQRLEKGIEWLTLFYPLIVLLYVHIVGLRQGLSLREIFGNSIEYVFIFAKSCLLPFYSSLLKSKRLDLEKNNKTIKGFCIFLVLSLFFFLVMGNIFLLFLVSFIMILLNNQLNQSIFSLLRQSGRHDWVNDNKGIWILLTIAVVLFILEGRSLLVHS